MQICIFFSSVKYILCLRINEYRGSMKRPSTILPCNFCTIRFNKRHYLALLKRNKKYGKDILFYSRLLMQQTSSWWRTPKKTRGEIVYPRTTCNALNRDRHRLQQLQGSKSKTASLKLRREKRSKIVGIKCFSHICLF